MWRSPRPAEIGFAGRSSEDVGLSGRQPNSAGRLCLSADPGLGGEPIGEPTHKHGMAKPRRSLGLVNLVATTTGPIR